ncbi:signal peptidase I [archaeon]|nr:signal peptidase I [archaeon]|tara:strand:+ start:85 stop:672 length:588 start_codon:yes stop_codon:yes gene_type:complete
MEFKKILKDIWYFIWKEDSIWSWLTNVLLAFILVKFIIYPLLGLLLVTSHPLVAVVSGSMEHDGSFENWWDSQSNWYTSHDFTKEQIKSWSFSNGFNKGDIMLLYGSKPKNIKLGDVIVFGSPLHSDPIIHRVVNIKEENSKIYFQTKGDHNPDIIVQLGENNINEERYIGKAILRIPLLGWIKILFVELINVFR